MAYILLLLALLAQTHGCPMTCNCTQNSVNCVSKSLEYVPDFEDLNSDPLIIDLSGNAISLIDIDDFSFDRSDDVKEVFLNNSGVIAVEEAAFEELENLQELYLSDNLLNTVPENFIIHNENMVLLDLSSNYFTDMPKIRSGSLEVLTIARSGVSRIGNDALDELPNLRMLILSQNNLRSVDPAVFGRMSNLFLISVAFNPWHCNCKTIKLFDFLTDRKFVDLTETVQCLSEQKIFVDIYSENGVAPAFEDHCDDFDFVVDHDPEMELSLKGLEVASPAVTTSSSEKFEAPSGCGYFSDFSFVVLLGLAVVLSLAVGAVSGGYLTARYMSRSMRTTESTKELLSKLDSVRYD